MTAQQLKNSILQMAIQGKLVPQDPNDEPASVLLERIRAEKKQMVKDGKIKKEKNPSIIFRGDDNLPYEKVGDNEPVCIANEVPFEIPDSWEWVRLGQVVFNHGQKKPSSDFCYIDIGSIDNKNQKLNEDETILQASQAPSRARKILEDGDIIYSTVRPYLHNMCIINRKFSHEPIASTGFAVLSCYTGVSNKFLFYYLLSPAFDTYANDIENAKGVAYPAINDERLYKALIPIPPIQEQLRIVSRLEDLNPFVNKYNCQYERLESLNNNFPDQIKKSILQQAVQGKLVPQDPADEPASILLERIRAEKEQMIKDGKIKRDKHESAIYRKDDSYYEKVDGIERCIDDEVPFEIPNSWQWCRLKSVVNIVSARRVHQSDWQTRGIPFYRAREIAKLAENGFVENELFISEKLYNEYKKSGVPHPGDLMVTAVGTLGKTYVVRPSDRFYYKDASVICFENFGKLFPLYVQLVMQTPFMKTVITGSSSGTTVGTITIVKANEYLIPIPPLPEQERIVEKVERLLSKIKEI